MSIEGDRGDLQFTFYASYSSPTWPSSLVFILHLFPMENQAFPLSRMIVPSKLCQYHPSLVAMKHLGSSQIELILLKYGTGE